MESVEDDFQTVYSTCVKSVIKTPRNHAKMRRNKFKKGTGIKRITYGKKMKGRKTLCKVGKDVNKIK